MEQYVFSLEQVPFALANLHTKVDTLMETVKQIADLNRAKPDQFMNIQEAAELLGLQVDTLYKLVNQREIPHSKARGRLRFSEVELGQWVKSGRRKTNAEMQEEAKSHMSNKKRGN